MMIRRELLAPLIAVLVFTGCGGRGSSNGSDSVHFDVGGAVVAEADPELGLQGVSITLVDVEGEITEATTSVFGLWTASDLKPGPYAEQYALDGYEPVSSVFTLDAFGENDVSNPFVSRPTVFLEEEHLRADLAPFSLELEDGSEVFDGLGGATLEYSLSAGDDLVVSMSLPCAGGFAIVDDMTTGDLVVASLDSGTLTSFTITGLQIAAMNGGAGLTQSSGSYDWHRMRVSATAYTPIHGDLVSLQAVAWFNARP